MGVLAIALIFCAMASMFIEPASLKSALTYTTIVHTTKTLIYSRGTTVVRSEERRGYAGTFHFVTTITSTYRWTETKWYYTEVPDEHTTTTKISPTRTPTTGPVPNGLIVRVEADRSGYAVGDVLVGAIWVTDSYGNPIPGSLVGITYVKDGRIFGDDSAITDTNGRVFMGWQWKEEHIGDWEIIASASKEGYASARGSARLSVQPRSPLTVSIKTDRVRYEQGEAVTVSGEVRYKNEPTPPKDRTIAIEVLQVPNRQYARPTFKWHTDERGRYSVMPFAGWEIGEYTIRAVCDFDTGKGVISAKSEPWSFYVEAAAPVRDMRAQFKEILKLYQDPSFGVPEGPLRRAIVRKDELFKPPRIVEWGLIPEGMYGAYTNLLHLTARDPKIKDLLGPYTCGGYQAQTLRFMDRLRFHEDPEVRKLLKGLDYGPIARGFLPLGAHYAVVLYPIGTDWKWTPEYAGQFARVFDPWPTQKPEAYYVEEFERPWGFARESGFHKSDPNNLWSGYPLTGGAVYVNYEVLGNRPAPPQERPSAAVVVDCPVDVLITDSEGRRLGKMSDDVFMQEFPAFIYRNMEGGEAASWYLELPKGAFALEITGRSAGKFNLLIGGEAVGDQILKYGGQEITKGGTARITIGAGDRSPPLSLPDGRKANPESFKEPESAFDMGALIFAAPLIAGAALLLRRSYAKRGSGVAAPKAHRSAKPGEHTEGAPWGCRGPRGLRPSPIRG
ncbi:MAG: hypothetical protein QXU06_00890 [Candidatus Bathyarchaeia archaeon]